MLLKSVKPSKDAKVVPNLLMEAQRHFAQGRADLAEQALQTLVAENPGEKEAWVALGVIASEQSMLELAIERMTKALAIDPSDRSSLCWVSAFLLQMGDANRATDFARLAVAAHPEDGTTHAALARCLVAGGSAAEATSHFRTAIRLLPNTPPLLVELTEALVAQNRWLEAKETLRQAVLLAPHPRELIRLAQLELRFGTLEDADRYGRRALRKAPETVDAQVLAARILTEKLEWEEAEIHWQKAAVLEQKPGSVSLEKALSLSAAGRFEDASLELRSSLLQDPNQSEAYRALMFSKKVDVGDLPMVGQIERLLADPSRPVADRVNLHYALGKAYDNLGRYEEAMGQFDAANAMDRDLSGAPCFDPAGFTAEIDATIRLFSSELFANWRHERSQSSLPIMVVGMMRSGTSLVEQILSAHPRIAGAGELSFWGECDLATLDPGKLKSAAAEYFRLLSLIAPGFSHVVDKNPANVQLLGLAHLAFPNARILCTRRDAVDTALSIWMTPINTTADFIDNRESIVYAYKEIMRLMDHWREVLPPDRYLVVDYKELVTEPEAVVPRLIEFCGEEWDEACLHPENNDRRVRTPSMWQVRQPIYRSSMGRSRVYEPWLGPFAELQRLAVGCFQERVHTWPSRQFEGRWPIHVSLLPQMPLMVLGAHASLTCPTRLLVTGCNTGETLNNVRDAVEGWIEAQQDQADLAEPPAQFDLITV